jgi:glycosyltransferase involved in cell wall biosynthesis
MQTRPNVLLIDALQWEISASKPESLCGTNSIIASFLNALSTSDLGLSVLILIPARYAQLSLDRAHERFPNFEFITAAALVERHRASRIVLQCMGHGIDRAAELRQRAGRVDWPIIGMTHDLFDRAVCNALANYALWNAPASDTIICASECGRRTLRYYCSRIEQTLGVDLNLRLPVIPHGIESRAIRRWSGVEAKARLDVGDRTVFLYFGRISLWQKADLVGLVRCFCKSFGYQNAVLIIAGGATNPDANPDLKLVRQTISSLGAEWEDRIRVIPNTGDEMKNILFSAADVFVSPANSLQETFGLALVEAMLYQLPVIATRWSGYAEIVIDNVTGYLTGISVGSHGKLRASTFCEEPERSISAVEAATIDWTEFGARMLTLARDRRLRLRFGLAGLERARERFSILDMVGNYVAEWNARYHDQPLTSAPARQWRGPRSEILASIALGHPLMSDYQPHQVGNEG